MRLLKPKEVTDRLKVAYHESVDKIREAEDLDQILLALVFAARHFLDPIHLYSVRDNSLICQLALDQQALKDVQQRSLPLADNPLVSRVTANGILYLGPIPKSDPSIKFLPTTDRNPEGVGVLPIVIKGRTLFVLMGYLLVEPSRKVLEDLAMLGTDTAMAIASLIIKKRRAQPSPPPLSAEPEEQDSRLKRVNTALQWPAVGNRIQQPKAEKPAEKLDHGNQKAGTTPGRPAKFCASKKVITAHAKAQVIPLKKLKHMPTKPMWPMSQVPAPGAASGGARLGPSKAARPLEKPAEQQSRTKKPAEQIFELITPKKRLTIRVPQLANTPAVVLQPEYLSASSTKLDDVVELLYPKGGVKDAARGRDAGGTSPEPHKATPAAGGKGAPAASQGTGTARTASPSDRMHVRFPLEVEVSYSSDHNFFTGFMENISDGGIFVATYASFEIGERLELVFTLPGISGWCTTVCEVRWIREFNPDLPDAIPGMGLRFLHLDERLIPAIVNFTRQRDPIFYDD